MKSVITEEIIRRIGARLSRALNRDDRKAKKRLPKHITSAVIAKETTEHSAADEAHRDTGDFAFVGNHEPQFIAE